jgi:hypothetical protein
MNPPTPPAEGEPDAGREFATECPAYWTGQGWHCPIAGSEDCDWECTAIFEDDDT